MAALGAFVDEGKLLLWQVIPYSSLLGCSHILRPSFSASLSLPVVQQPKWTAPPLYFELARSNHCRSEADGRSLNHHLLPKTRNQETTNARLSLLDKPRSNCWACCKMTNSQVKSRSNCDARQDPNLHLRNWLDRAREPQCQTAA